MSDRGYMTGSEAHNAESAFAGSTRMLQVYHRFVQPGTDVLETRLSIPPDLAPMVSLCAGIFVPLYFLGSFLFSSFRFHGRVKWEMSSAVPSMLHGIVSTIVGSLLLFDHWKANGALVADAANSVKDTALIQFSCAYFMHDLFIYVGIFAPHERLFAMHHVAVLAYMLTTLSLGYGNITAVLAITMGEITSPIQNVWFLLKNLRYRYRLADQMFAYISWMYSAFYIFIRSGVGLFLVLYNAAKVHSAPRFSTAVRGFLLFILYGGCAASQLWCFKISSRLRSKYRPAYGKTPKGDDSGTELGSRQEGIGQGQVTMNGGASTMNGGACMMNGGTGQVANGVGCSSNGTKKHT